VFVPGSIVGNQKRCVAGGGLSIISEGGALREAVELCAAHRVRASDSTDNQKRGYQFVTPVSYEPTPAPAVPTTQAVVSWGRDTGLARLKALQLA
jgi:hypothetical protein